MRDEVWLSGNQVPRALRAWVAVASDAQMAVYGPNGHHRSPFVW